MSANIEQIKAMLERAGKTNLLQKKEVDLDKERLQLEAAVNIEKVDKFAQWDAEHLADARKTSPNVLEEAAMKYAHCPFTDDDGNFHEDAIDGTAYHDFIAAAKWQKKQDEEELSEKIAAAYQLGLADKEKQMMSKAVEGEITKDNRGNNVVRAGVFNKDFEYGDKVRVIVLKKED